MTPDQCPRCWINRHTVAELRAIPHQVRPVSSPGLQPLTIVRPVRCLHLTTRLEFKQGCGGMRCRHECDLGLPAVPGVYCQTCGQYEEDAGPWV